MRGVRQTGIFEAGMQKLYEKAFFGEPNSGKGALSVLWTGTDFHEGKMHGLPRKSCITKYKLSYSALFIQALEQRTDVQVENSGRKELFADICKTFV